MHHAPIQSATPAPKNIRPHLFICAGCDLHQHELTPELPIGWAVVKQHAFCGDCGAPEGNG